MSTVAMVKEGCGTHFVFDHQEQERHEKLGWKVRPADWKAVKTAEDAERRKAAAKAEMARLAKEVAALEAAEGEKAEEPAKKKGGRPKKAKE